MKHMNSGQCILAVLAYVMITTVRADPSYEAGSTSANAGQPATLDLKPPGLWQGGVGDGLLSSVQTIELKAGEALGVAILGSRQAHDLGLASLSYGHMWGGVRGAEDSWYRGNWEIRGELFGGSQFNQSGDWVVGLTPHLRYDFATGTRWVPFVDAGAGVSATGIGSPDLGGTFEFNLQCNAGVHWFMRDHLALTLEAGYLHLSCAGIDNPNLGVNGVTGMAGITWFF